MTISKPHLELMEKNGWSAIPEHLPFGPFSLDVRLGELHKVTGIDGVCAEGVPDPVCTLEEIDITHGFELSVGEQYLWRPIEVFTLAPTIYACIFSRSGWARLGVAAASNKSTNAAFSYPRSTSMQQPPTTYHGKPICTLSAAVPVVVQRGDAIGQAIFHDSDFFDGVLGDEMRALLGNDLLVEGAVGVVGQHVPLTLDDTILIYRSGVLRKEQGIFEKVRLPKEGMVLPKGVFFLAASRERVSIPEPYVGHVEEFSTREYLANRDDYMFPVFSAHPNAPYIGPRPVFEGKITFENRMLVDAVVRPGMPLSALYLERLSTPVGEHMTSSYKGQQQATASKL